MENIFVFFFDIFHSFIVLYILFLLKLPSYKKKIEIGKSWFFLFYYFTKKK